MHHYNYVALEERLGKLIPGELTAIIVQLVSIIDRNTRKVYEKVERETPRVKYNVYHECLIRNPLSHLVDLFEVSGIDF